jgi:tetratricopeptide (TPR) repeat protein
VALFGKKKDGGSGGEETAAPEAFSPEKAGKFFERAQVVHDSGNYEYAMQLWLQGLRWDPSSMQGLGAYLRSAEGFVAENPKGKLGKEVRNVTSGVPKATAKYLDALIDFGLDKADAAAAVRVADAAGTLGIKEPARLLGRHALSATNLDPKRQKKDAYVRLLDVLETAEDFQAAAQAGEAAMRLDPSDGELQARVRNMMAQATMTRGGFDEPGKEGGFRKNIRDEAKQLELTQQDSIAKTGTVKDQIVERTKAAHEANPADLPALEAYCKALVERGKPADELKALALYSKAYSETKQFRFRERSGEIQLRRMRRNVAALEKQASEGSVEAGERLEAARAEMGKLELEEMKLQVEAYPTDLGRKFRLGRALLQAGQADEAIAQFQHAQDDPKHRSEVLLHMGRAFQKLGGWDDEAVATFRRGLEGVADPDGDLAMELRYGLLTALQAKAEHDRDRSAAEEADKLAGAIAIKSFGYKDIRERREKIKALLKELVG